MARCSAALIIEDTPTGLLVDNVAVAKAAQGTGLGRALMAFAEAEAARRGHRRVWLYTHEKMVTNIALYERLGFVETHRAEQAGFARVFMAKVIAPLPKPNRQPVQDRHAPAAAASSGAVADRTRPATRRSAAWSSSSASPVRSA